MENLEIELIEKQNKFEQIEKQERLSDLINTALKKGERRQVPRKKFSEIKPRKENGKSVIVYDEFFEGLAYLFDATGCAKGRFKLQYILYEGSFVSLEKFLDWYKGQEPIVKECIERFDAMHFVLKGFYEEFLYKE